MHAATSAAVPLVRRAAIEDLDAIDAIEQASFSVDRFARRALARLLNKANGACFVAEITGRPAGYASTLYRKGARAARLYSLAVDPGFRGRGVGPALLVAAEATARDHGCDRMRLEVRKTNGGALRLYRAAGYAVIAEKPAYFADGAPALQMEKSLTRATESEQ